MQDRRAIPTPLAVTQHRKDVTLKFNTQEESDEAWRLLSALAEAHADRVHKLQEHDAEYCAEIKQIQQMKDD